MSNFNFLKAEFPDLFASAVKAESLAGPDPRTACFYARRTLELAVGWMYRHDASLKSPYQDHLSALLHESTFRAAVGEPLHAKTKVIKDLGNQAVHSSKPVRPFDALTAVRELFHFTFWLARTYGRAAVPPDGLAFDIKLLPSESVVPPQALAQLQELEARLSQKDASLTELLSGKAAVDEELARLRAEIAAAKAQNVSRPDTHDYSEAETRDFFIDLLLKEAGWPLDQERDREYPVQGMPNEKGQGFVDYVLWGDDGLPLALVEAKRTKRDPRVGQQQAKLYADCLERQFGRRPVIFYSNGYEHWLWDDLGHPPRQTQGFLTKDELELIIQRRTSRKTLATAEISQEIVNRHYQTRAIRRICEAFETDNDRKALVVMATGAGKTRTVIALCDLLMRCNWVKRVLFLADRVALVNQAVNAFKLHLPASSPVNLVTEHDAQGRVYVSTYPTMMGLIDETVGDRRRFGVGYFDLVVIDEAHRSVYQKYRAIFDYFDSLLVGLTATPKDEIDRNTYSLFDLETGVPTDVYGLEEAVKDGFLVPARPVSVPLKFQREGIKYEQLDEAEKEQWDTLEWGEDDPPERVEAEAVNSWLFNADTVDKVLEHLMRRGQKVAGGDRLGKTIIFAKNHLHAEFIAERFNVNYPEYRGEFARVIDNKIAYSQSLIESFSLADSSPHIAISVDMLDTGIDVPEVVNLVFFKLIRSKTKFWQMVGRGTRLCQDLFGPGKDKAFFYLFDYCMNLEYFSQNPETEEGSAGASLGKRLFLSRLELLAELDKLGTEATEGDLAVRAETADHLHEEVAAMNVDNFIVRPKRKLVEKYRIPEAWAQLNLEEQAELAHEVAGLPTGLIDNDLEAKRFDLLLFNLELARLRAGKDFERLREVVRMLCGKLAEKNSIPMVREQLPLILEVQGEEFWQDVTVPMLETVRRRLRSLVKLIEKTSRPVLFTNFEDEIGEGTTIELSDFGSSADMGRFLAKTRQFLRKHENHIAIHKLRMNEPLTPLDLEELDRMLRAAGLGSDGELDTAVSESQGLGLFVRSLVGLDRQAAKQAFSVFLQDKAMNANQVEFINLIIDHLTEKGAMEPARLYDSPFTDFHPLGVTGLFTTEQVGRITAVLEGVGRRAVA